MIGKRRSRLLRYSSAIIAIVLATLLRWRLDPLLGNQAPFTAYFVAIMFAAWYGGFGPSLVALLSGALLGDYFFVEPRGTLLIYNPTIQDLEHQVGLGLYIFVGIVVSLLSASLHASRRRAEASLAQLEASEERFRTVADFTYDWEAWIGPDGVFLYVSPSCKGITGYSAEEFLADGQLLEKIAHPEDRAAVVRHRQECRAGKEPLCLEFRIITRGGELRWIEHICQAVYGKQGNYLGRRASNRDATLRKQAEAALRLTQFSVDHAGDTVFWLEPDARFAYANFRAYDHLGYTREELLSMTVHDIDPNYPAEVWPKHWEELKRRGAFTFESQHRRKDGRLVPVEISVNYVEFAGKQYNCAFVRDISERKRGEEALEQERNLLRTLIDNLPDCIYVKDTQSRFLAANLAVARMMGAAAPNELLGKTDADFYPAERAAEYRRDEQELLRSGQPVVNKDEPHLDSAGNLRAVLTTKVPFEDGQGKVVGLVGISRDITERQQAEEQVRQAQQHVLELQQREKEHIAAELSKARDVLVRQTRLAVVGQLSASIAHELRNPLAAIGNAAFLLKHKLPQHESKWHEYLQMICSQVQAAHGIITDCMAMSRGTPPAKTPVALAPLITKIQSQVDTPNEVHWHCSLESDPFWIYADATQIEHVLRNLLVNSIQSLGGGGTIRIDAAHCGQYDQIRVSDNGPGIPPQIRDQVFEPLVTAKPQGTGLGLTICRQIIEQHGGTVELLDLPGPGAAFQIHLPHAAAEPQATAVTSTRNDPGDAASAGGRAS